MLADHPLKLVVGLVVVGIVAVITAAAVPHGGAEAAGSEGPISWSDDETGMTSSTGFVFGSNCTSTRPVNPGEESAVLGLINGWAADAVAGGFSYLLPATTPPDGSSGDAAVLSFPGSAVTATVTRRQVPPADAVDPTNGSVGALSNNAVFSDNRRMQDCAPRPDDLLAPPAGMALASNASFSGSAAAPARFWNATTFPAGNQLDAALFEFSQPVGAFGLWFGDLETRQAEPGNGAVLAVVKLLDSSGSVIASTEVLPDEAPPNNAVCGGPDIKTDNLGCGNQSTRFIGFVEPAANVAAMLVIVGDDDACDQLSNGRCEGITEYLSWIGPMLAEPQPDLTVTKVLTTPPLVPADPVSWTIQVSNIGTGSASAGWSVSDTVGAGANGLALSGNAAEVDCAAVTSCTGLVALAPGDTVTVMATATHTASPGVAVDNVVEVTPLASDRPELIPAGPSPVPGDDTSATATNNDADVTHVIPTNPSVVVDKRVNGVDADVPPGLAVSAGSLLTYEIDVMNNGNMPLSDVVLLDELSTTGSMALTVVPTFTGGDDNDDDVLDPGETWTYQWMVAAGLQAQINTATATAISGTDTVSGSDQAHTSPKTVELTTTSTSIGPETTSVPTSTSTPSSETTTETTLDRPTTTVASTTASTVVGSTSTTQSMTSTTPTNTRSTADGDANTQGSTVPGDAAPETLARTGASSSDLIVFGLALTLFGGSMLLARSRLRRHS